MSSSFAADPEPEGKAHAVRSAAFGDPGSQNAMARWLGLRWDDHCTARLTIRADLINEAGLLLGPVGFALVDYAMGAALWVQTSEDEHIATISITINYVQSATAGDVICRAQVDRRNRRIAVLRSETHHEDGRLLATAVGSYSIFPPRVGFPQDPGRPAPVAPLERRERDAGPFDARRP